MKTKIVGWLLIVAGAVLLFYFILAVSSTGMLSGPNKLLISLMLLVFGLYSIVLGSAIKAQRKWAWYAGLITIGLATLGNLITLILSSSLALILPLLLDFFTIYALLSEKKLFFPV